MSAKSYETTCIITGLIFNFTTVEMKRPNKLSSIQFKQPGGHGNLLMLHSATGSATIMSKPDDPKLKFSPIKLDKNSSLFEKGLISSLLQSIKVIS